jgi:putative hydrolase of the HAD superfamily
VRIVQAVFLDVGWTLAYPQVSMWEIFADLCTQAGVATTPEACEGLVRTLWSSGLRHAEAQFHAGASYPDSDEMFAGQFAQMGMLIFSQMGVTDGQAELTQRFLQAFWNDTNWVTYPDTLEGLAALKARGGRLGVLSNAPSDMPRFLERLGILPYLDFTVVSALEGMKKPDRRIFAAALARAGVEPAAALHVGDMYLEDIVGGRAAGVNTLLMERGKHALFPSFPESDGRGLEPATVVTSLAGVLERLG